MEKKLYDLIYRILKKKKKNIWVKCPESSTELVVMGLGKVWREGEEGTNTKKYIGQGSLWKSTANANQAL